jgi:hypothetical protein
MMYITKSHRMSKKRKKGNGSILVFNGLVMLIYQVGTQRAPQVRAQFVGILSSLDLLSCCMPSKPVDVR